MVRSKCSLKTHVQNLGYSLSLQIGSRKPPFWMTSQLMATLTAYIFWMKPDTNNWLSAMTTTRGLLHRTKMSWTWSTNGFKWDPNFYTLYINSAFYFIARLHRWTPANRTPPNFAKGECLIALTTCRRKVVVVSPLRKNWAYVRFLDDFET